VVAAIDADKAGETFCGLPVKASVANCGPLDVVIVTDLTKPGTVYQAISAEMEPDRILAPSLLRIAMPKSVDFDTARRAAE